MVTNEEWILVMDNFDTISIDTHPFTPSSRMGKVIFTSRDRRSIETVEGRGFELKKPSMLDAERQFLLHRHRIDFVPPEGLETLPEYHAVREIVRELHGFPLALSQAAAYIRENDPFTYAEYLFIASHSPSGRARSVTTIQGSKTGVS
jgi:hypothetical protein